MLIDFSYILGVGIIAISLALAPFSLAYPYIAILGGVILLLAGFFDYRHRTVKLEPMVPDDDRKAVYPMDSGAPE